MHFVMAVLFLHKVYLPSQVLWFIFCSEYDGLLADFGETLRSPLQTPNLTIYQSESYLKSYKCLLHASRVFTLNIMV